MPANPFLAEINAGAAWSCRCGRCEAWAAEWKPVLNPPPD